MEMNLSGTSSYLRDVWQNICAVKDYESPVFPLVKARAALRNFMTEGSAADRKKRLHNLLHNGHNIELLSWIFDSVRFIAERAKSVPKPYALLLKICSELRDDAIKLGSTINGYLLGAGLNNPCERILASKPYKNERRVHSVMSRRDQFHDSMRQVGLMA